MHPVLDVFRNAAAMGRYSAGTGHAAPGRRGRITDAIARTSAGLCQRRIRQGRPDCGCRRRTRRADLSRPRLSVPGFRLEPRHHDRRLGHATDGTRFGPARTEGLFRYLRRRWRRRRSGWRLWRRATDQQERRDHHASEASRPAWNLRPTGAGSGSRCSRPECAGKIWIGLFISQLRSARDREPRPGPRAQCRARTSSRPRGFLRPRGCDIDVGPPCPLVSMAMELLMVLPA